MQIKTMLVLVLLLAVSAPFAQGGSDQSDSPTKPAKKSKGDITVQGCLSRATGDYILIQIDPGNTYKLEKANGSIKLGPHLGEQVEVSGWKSPSLSTSSDSLNRAGTPASITLMVTAVRTLSAECTPREVPTESAAGRGAQLQVSSTPDDADISIDGNFVGNTTSSMNVAPGEHQLVVKKKGYKPWEKKIEVTSGQVKVHADLEAESR